MVKEDFCSGKTTKLLLEKNCPLDKVIVYDKPFPIYYTKPKEDPDWRDCDAYYIPTISQARKWLRLEHGIYIEAFCPVVDADADKFAVTYNVVISNLRNQCLSFNTPFEDTEFASPELAIEVGIQYVLENLI